MSPDQVLVVYNSQSTDATAVKDAYLAAHPDIPTANVLDLNSTAIANRADITYSEFTSNIRDRIRTHLDLNADAIVSICLIRGIPHRIKDTDNPMVGDDPSPTGAGPEFNSGDMTCASVDSELVLLWQTLETGEAGGDMDSKADNFIQNPYHRSTANIQTFNRSAIKNPKTFIVSGAGWIPSGTKQNPKLTPGDMYLVCRIDGATTASAIDSIARAANGYVNRKYGWTILDEDGQQLDDDEYYATSLPDYENTRDHLRAAGFNVLYDNTTTFITSTAFVRPVIAYASYGENHKDSPPGMGTYIEGFHFAPGAIFNTIESYNGRDLNGLDTFKITQEQVADFIAAGGTFGIGHVWEPFSISIADNDYLFSAMLTRGMTWAEAAWSSIPFLSWMHVVIGDPLGRVIQVVDQPADFDADADVDQSDFDYVQNCATGPGMGPPTPNCTQADLNQDGSIDSVDFARLQRCYSESPTTLNPACE